VGLLSLIVNRVFLHPEWIRYTLAPATRERPLPPISYARMAPMDVVLRNVCKKPTVVVAQANQMDSQLLADAIERQCRLQVAACPVNSASVISAVQEKRPDLILISPRLQDGMCAGLRVAKTLHASGTTSRIVTLLESEDRDLVLESFRCGATGVLTRNDSSQDLCKCMTVVLQGDIWASSTQLKYLVDAFAQTHPPILLNVKDRRALTKREDEVLRLLAAGLTDREIGNSLKLNENRVKNYVSGMFQKLGLSSRAELALFFSYERSEPCEQEERYISKDKFGT
jgi:DNA-binding NarL/FixJ family response regulator